MRLAVNTSGSSPTEEAERQAITAILAEIEEEDRARDALLESYVAERGWAASERPFRLVELGRRAPLQRLSEAERAVFDAVLARALGQHQTYHRDASGAPA